MLWMIWAVTARVEGQGRERDREATGGREREHRRQRVRGRERESGREREMESDTRPLIRPRQEVVNAVETDPGKPDENNFLTVHTVRHSELSGNEGGGFNVPNVSAMADSEIERRQMDTIILLLQRLSDRLTVLETLQIQRGERMDTVHYRLTRMELQAEERKSVINELSNNVRHRMETRDGEMDQIMGHLDDIKSAVTTLNLQNTDLKSTVNTIALGVDGGQESRGPKLQAIMASLYGLRSTTQSLKQDLSKFAQNMTKLSTIPNQLGELSEKSVTKQYLLQNLNELRTQQLSSSVPMMQPRARQGQGSKGKAIREPEDCWKLLQKGKKKSGVYRIQPYYSTVPFFVYCDMETDGGGWTVIQRREDGTVDFLREWAEYKHGFGNLAGEFWLGNEKIYLLTNQHVSKLRVDLADFDQQEGHALYSAFAMGSELEGYSMKMLGQYTGDAGDSLRYHVGRRFSTIDVDHDAWPEASCARDHSGAWWYRACETSNLNGRYLHGPVPPDHEYTGLYWYDFHGPQYSLWRSRMMIRRGGNVGDPIFKDFQEVQNQASTARPNTTEPAKPPTRPTETPDYQENFNPDHDPYAAYDYPYDPYG